MIPLPMTVSSPSMCKPRASGDDPATHLLSAAEMP